MQRDALKNNIDEAKQNSEKYSKNSQKREKIKLQTPKTEGINRKQN